MGIDYAKQIKVLWGSVDISPIIASATWSGGVTEAARRLDFSIAHGVQDCYLPTYDIQCGDKIKFYEEGKELFRGTVIVRNKSSVNGTLEYTAYDDVFYLLHNKTSYNFGNATAEDIARRVLNDHNFEVHPYGLAYTGIPQSLLSNDLCLYDIIQAAYTNAYKVNGLLYGIVAREGKFIVYQRGWAVTDFIISDDENLTESSFSESIESMVNTVKIADVTGTQVGYVRNSEWFDKYGSMKDIVYQEDGIDSYAAANALLQGTEQTASLVSIGHSKCLFGNSVKVKDTGTGLVGLFYIQSDSHTWENGSHMMSLELMFNAFMDEKEGQESSSDSGGGETGQTVSALFTAYYPANNKMEGGFFDCIGNRLDPSKKTCAAPKSIPLGTKIKVMSTGTSEDGVIYTVNDRGGAITVINGVHHFDLLMSTNAQCNNWGRVNGQALIISEDSNTASSEDSNTTSSTGNSGRSYGYPLHGNFSTGAAYGKRGKSWKCGWHTGQDYTAGSNKNIYAVTSGKVISAGYKGSYGNCVMVRHNDGYLSVYSHMSKIKVSVGATVNINTSLGVQGSTGNSTGAHLHLEIHSGNYNYPANTNPATYLKARVK